MKLFFLVLFLCLANCAKEPPDVFVTQHNLSSSITFDFTKSYTVKVGTVTFLNKENKKKKWRYIYHAPLACLYNKKTKKCDDQKGMPLVSHNPSPEVVDSLFWSLLDSATWHTPVKPYGSTQVTVYLNLNSYPQPGKLIQYIKDNHEDLEYHIFIRSGSGPLQTKMVQGKYKVQFLPVDMSGPPDFIIRSIQVIH